MHHSNLLLSFIFLSLFVYGCYDTPCESGKCSSKKVYTEDDLEDLNIKTNPLKNNIFIGDTLGLEAYYQINKKLQSGEAIRIPIYRFKEQSIDELIQNAQSTYQLTSSSSIEMNKYIVSRGDVFECSWNMNSLYEFCYDVDRFESSSGVERNSIMADEDYYRIANQIKDDLIQLQLPHNDILYPYKRKYGVNESASIENPDDIHESIYDIGIAFASIIDDWPVIGPGGKVYIHLSPDGSLLATKTFRKVPGEILGTLTENDIKTADEALQELVTNKLYNLDEYQITRAEFGYFYWGKNSIQNILSPYYVFFFAPADSQYTTEVVEIVSAVKGKFAQMIDEDYQLEVERKQSQLTHDTSDTTK